jgi:hypothetical protein
MSITPLPFRAGLKEYKKLAAALIKAYRSGNPAAMYCIRQLHPRLRGRYHTNDRNKVTDAEIRRAKVTLADAQAVIARWHGFENWPELEKHVAALEQTDSLVLQFESAVEAIIKGDLATLKRLLLARPDVIQARSTREHHATLLHYVGANGVEGYRQVTPQNAVKVARVLLAAGAEVDADLAYGGAMRKRYRERIGSTTLGMVATSVHPAVAGVQIELLKTLIAAGAAVDGLAGGWNPLLAALHNGRGDAAEFLAKSGARLDLEGAAGTGQLDAVRRFFKKDGGLKAGATKAQLEHGFMWACEYGHTRVVAFLLKQGVDVHSQPHGETGLHWAAYSGHADIVGLLLKHGAPVDVKDSRFQGTPLGWALYGWCNPPPEANRRGYFDAVARLVAAGAEVDWQWLGDDSDRQVEKVRNNRQMRASLQAQPPQRQ